MNRNSEAPAGCPARLGVPGTGEVGVWLAMLPDGPVDGLDPAVLDAVERERVAAFVRDEHRYRYLAAHVLLRRVLGACLGRDPAGLTLVREACPRCGEGHGRPAVAGAPDGLHFSLSHTGPLAAVAVAAAPVGVDVEALPRPETVDGVAAVLHPAEQAEVAAGGAAAFARLWTRKEAYLKGLGIGLARDLALDYVGSELPGPDGWTLADLTAPDGYAAAVAVREQPRGRSTRPLVPGLTWLGADLDPQVADHGGPEPR